MLVGAALIAASFIINPAGGVPFLTNLGITMVLGGVAQMLAVAPKINNNSGAPDSPVYSFGSPTVTIGQGRPVPLFYGGPLEVGGAIALLVGVWKIREALVDAEFPLVDLKEAGRPYRVRVVRVRGNFGATYQLPGGEPVTVEPKFRDMNAVLHHVRKSVAAS